MARPSGGHPLTSPHVKTSGLQRVGRHLRAFWQGRLGKSLLAVIVAIVGWFGAPLSVELIKQNFLSEPPRPGVVTPGDRLDRALEDLTMSDEGVRASALTRLGILLDEPTTTYGQREQVMLRLASFVQDQAPAHPGPRSFEYCAKDPAPRYQPVSVGLALRIMGSKRTTDGRPTLDLTNVNMAYANLSDLDLRRVRLEGSLLCRSFLNGSRFESADLTGANFRFAIMERATGVTAEQLTSAESIYRLHLPAYLASSQELRERREIDSDGPGANYSKGRM